jgi:hypothetical protein
MKTKQILFALPAILLLTWAACGNDSNDTPPATAQDPLTALSVKVGESYYHAKIDQAARRIEIGTLTLPNTAEYVSAVEYTLGAEGAGIDPDLRTFLGKWKREQDITVTTADGVQTIYTIVFTRVDGSAPLPQRRWLWSYYGRAYEPDFSRIEPYKDMIHALSLASNQILPPVSKAFVDACHDNNILASVKVGGKTEDLATAAQVTELVKQYLADCDEMGYDGIDLNYESLAAAVKDNYASLVAQLSEGLHARGKLLAVTVSIWEQGFIDTEVMSASCDYIRFMAYDVYYAGGPTTENRKGFNIPYNTFVERINSGWAKRFPAAKCIWCLPAYSNCYFTTSAGVVTGEQWATGHILSGTVTHEWRDDAKANYYTTVNANGTRTELYASDGQSTQWLLDALENTGFPHEVGFFDHSFMDAYGQEMWNVVRTWTEK